MKIGVIGFGNLGKAFVKGIIRSGIKEEDIGIVAKSERTRNHINEIYPNSCSYDDIKMLVNNSDVIVLIVEPQNSPDVFKDLLECNLDNKIIVSLMAGVTISTIHSQLKDTEKSYRILRAMPNIAISNCKGIIGLSFEQEENVYGCVIELFNQLGYVVKLPEKELEKITVTAASGLAFASCLFESYQNAVDSLFQDTTMSQNITLKVFENVLELVKEKNITFQQLIEMITTKGGSTEAGIKSLDIHYINNTLGKCMKDAYQHTKGGK